MLVIKVDIQREQIITNLMSGMPFLNIIIDQGEIQVPLLNPQ